MQRPQPASEAEHAFILEEYFAGRLRAWGMFVDRFGNVRRQFNVDIRGDIDDGKLILTENFVFDDGERSQRIWRITPLGEGHYSGRAYDVVGTAEGKVTGNQLRWSYDLNLAIGGREWQVHFDDVMLLRNDQVLLNRASMSKFGITLGEVIICFQKEAAPVEDDTLEAGHAIRDTAGFTRVGAEVSATTYP